jgi:ribonuclease E
MLKEIVPSEAGVIIRTASEGVSHEALERDVRRLQAQWEVVKTRSEQTGPNKPKAPVLLYEEPDLLIKVVRDQFNEDFSRLVVEGDEAWDTLQNYVGHVASDLAPRLHRHVGTQDVFAAYRIDEQLLKALDRKVWLPSGGTLVIDRTEAMTVIDVNTGKFTGSGGNLEETVTRNNLEAAEEVVRQLRLRDIGGIIVVDFIDMVLEANRDLVLRRLTECLARDRTRHQVAEVTSLGLVQMTRKRVGGGLLEHFSTPCEHCRGRGVIVNAEPLLEPEPGRSVDRAQPVERESGRRSRGRGRRDSGDGDTEREGRRESGRRNGSTRNGSPMDVATRTGLDTSAEDFSTGSAGSTVADAAGSETRVPVDEQAAGLDVGAPLEAAEVAIAAEAPVADVPAGVEPDVVGVTDVAADAVEEVVVERSLAEPRPAAAQPVDARSVDARPVDARPVDARPVDAQPVEPQPVDAQPAAEGRNGASRTPRARRGRVTRTAGAPDPTSGDTPVAVVVTVPGPAATGPDASPEPALAGSPPVVPPQPAPSPVTRPRRSRRAASRPAGPPAAESPEAGADAGGDPV